MSGPARLWLGKLDLGLIPRPVGPPRHSAGLDQSHSLYNDHYTYQLSLIHGPGFNPFMKMLDFPSCYFLSTLFLFPPLPSSFFPPFSFFSPLSLFLFSSSSSFLTLSAHAREGYSSHLVCHSLTHSLFHSGEGAVFRVETYISIHSRFKCFKCSTFLKIEAILEKKRVEAVTAV